MKKILLVDPAPESRHNLRIVLQTEHLVIDASTGEEAVARAGEHHPDLILLDLDLPDINGASLCARLKEQGTMPVILFTTNEHNDDLFECLHAGAEDYLTKPLCENELLVRIDTHLRTCNYYSELKHQDLLMLLELSEIISVTRNPHKILDIIVQKMAQVLDVSRCSIININDDGELIVKASSDLVRNHEVKLDPLKYPEIAEALSTRKPVIVQDIRNNPLMASVRGEVEGLLENSIIVVPIVKKLSVLGTFFLRTTSPLSGEITERIFKLCQVVARISGHALENAMLFETMYSTKRFLEDLAVRDGLTKLYNHQYFYSRLEEEFSRAHRHQLPLSCLFIDIDNFKNINDRFGHLAGDVVLRQIGRLIKQVLRMSDIAARYGGEEFTLLLPNTGYDGAMELAERLRRMISKLSDRVQVTASIGVSSYPNRQIKSSDALLHLADQAMYQAKQSGKNCVRYLDVSC